MPKVTGRLTDFGLNAMADNAPRVVFEYTSPGVAQSSILATHPVVSVPAYNGFFEADLVESAKISPAGFYRVFLEWRDDTTRTYRRDELPGELYVPAAGGVLADLLRVPSNPALVWTGTEPPPNPAPGSWWQKPTGDLYEWGGDGWNYKTSLRGPAGYNATGAAADMATIAAYLLATAGANPVSEALDKRVTATTYNVKLLGLKGNGSTDDTAALRAAIDALPAPAAAFGVVAPTLYFPAGRYIIDGSLRFTQRVALQGDGPNKTILYRKANATGDFITLAGPQAELRDLTVDCNRNGKATGDAVVMEAGGTALRYVEITNVNGTGVNIGKTAGAIGHNLDRVKIRYCSQYGVHMKAGTGSTDGVWSNVDVGLAGLSGIRIEQGASNLSNVHIWGCGIEDTSGKDGHGFHLYSSSNMLVNCQSETNNQYGFLIEGTISSANTLSNCRAWGNGKAGFTLKSARRGTLTGCIAHNNGAANHDPATATYEHSGFLNLGSNGFSLTGCQAWDGQTQLKPGEYTSGVTPVNPFLGRPAGIKTQAYGYYEVRGDTTPYANKITGNQWRAQDHAIAGAVTVGIDAVWAGNDLGNQAPPTLTPDGGQIYLPPWSPIHLVEAGTLSKVAASPAGTRATLIFTAAEPGYVTVTGNIRMAAQFRPRSGQSLSLICDGTNWHETGRS